MLKKKDLELQESLIKFNKFLQENDSKRSRAEKKEKEEIKQRLVKEQARRNECRGLRHYHCLRASLTPAPLAPPPSRRSPSFTRHSSGRRHRRKAQKLATLLLAPR